MNSIFRAFGFYLVYIAAVIIIPLIIIGIAILKKYKNNRNQVIAITFSIICTIIIYACQYQVLTQYTKNVLEIIDNYSLKEIFYTKEKAKQEEKNTIDSFNGYIQKMAKQMYIDKFDVTQILNIANSRKDIIKVIYKDVDKNIDIEKTNKDENWQNEILEKAEGNYYKFNCDYKLIDNSSSYVKDIVLTIEKYQNDTLEVNEINQNIIIEGQLRPDLVNRVDKYENAVESINYVFENNVIKQNKVQNEELENFKILLVYDNKTKNYIPYTNDESQYLMIKSYKIYSTGISITLEEGVKLKNKYYSLRINRYNEEGKIEEKKDNKYYYNFEPVVTQMSDWNDNIVLELKYNNTYKLEDLKNIEIIFGIKLTK